VDHWFKNVFVLPGVVVALGFAPLSANAAAVEAFLVRLVVGLLAVCLVASSNYVLNEILDAASDMHHPEKSQRAVPSGRVDIRLAYIEWAVLAAIGIGIGALLSFGLGVALAALWAMGCVYNVPPIRSKDLPYIDVLSESVNNPLRMLVGWYIVNPGGLAPVSLLVSYWMVGCYFMAIKRFAEFRHIGDRGRATAYRRSFARGNAFLWRLRDALSDRAHRVVPIDSARDGDVPRRRVPPGQRRTTAGSVVSGARAHGRGRSVHSSHGDAFVRRSACGGSYLCADDAQGAQCFRAAGDLTRGATVSGFPGNSG
jgi:4-hydroxybenzoate polyprenyltransferase